MSEGKDRMSPAQRSTRYVVIMATHSPPPKTAREWVGRNIRRERDRRGLTVEQLARLLSDRGFLIDKSQVSRIETGKQNCDVEKLLAFADALQVNPDRLLRDPDQLDAALFVRIRRHWRSAEQEAKRYSTLATLLLEELSLLADRVPPDPETGWTARESLADDAWADDLVRWIPSVARVAPEHPDYGAYIERLAAGDLTVDYSELSAALEEFPLPAFTPKTPSKKATAKKARATKKGGK